MEHHHHNHSSNVEHPKSDVHSPLKYTCPMHPQIVQDGPGNCPICGMNLVSVKKSEDGYAGHDHHAMMIADFRKRFYVVLGLTIPVMLYGIKPLLVVKADSRLFRFHYITVKQLYNFIYSDS